MIKAFSNKGEALALTGEVYNLKDTMFYVVSYDEYVKNNALFLYQREVDELKSSGRFNAESLVKFNSWLASLPLHLEGKDYLCVLPKDIEIGMKLKNLLKKGEK